MSVITDGPVSKYPWKGQAMGQVQEMCHFNGAYQRSQDGDMAQGGHERICICMSDLDLD